MGCPKKKIFYTRDSWCAQSQYASLTRFTQYKNSRRIIMVIAVLAFATIVIFGRNLDESKLYLWLSLISLFLLASVPMDCLTFAVVATGVTAAMWIAADFLMAKLPSSFSIPVAGFRLSLVPA